MGAGPASLHRPGTTALHRLPPQCGLAAVLAYVVLVVLTPRGAPWAYALHLLAVLAAARAGVASYLRQVRAFEEYPGLRWSVRVDRATSSVYVRLTAPLDLPLGLPGAPEQPLVTAEGEGSTAVDP